MANEQVLVIEDSVESNQFIVDYVLKPNGYRVVVAYDGEEGLNIALTEKPDLILLDMNMPKMSGLDVLHALKEQDITIPVIVMTFHGSEKLAVQAFRLGIKDYVLKPFKVPEMLESITRALTEARLRQERDELTERLLSTNQELEQRVRELNTLFGIGKSVTSLLDQGRLLDRLMEAAIYLTKAEAASLLSLENKSQTLHLVAAQGLDDRPKQSQRQKIEDVLATEVMTTGQPLLMNRTEATDVEFPEQLSALIYVPLKNKDRVQGVLTVTNRQPGQEFTNHDLRLLSTLADYAAISLENARLFHQVESEGAKLATVLNEIDEPIMVIDNDDNIAMANLAFCQVFELGMTVVEEHSLVELLNHEALLEFAQKDPGVGGYKAEFSFEDRTFLATLTPILGVGRAVIMQDITHFKVLDQIKSDFVSTVSHDFRTPLLSLKGYAEMLEKAGPLTEKQRIFSERLASGIEKMMALVDNLLDLSKIDADFESDPRVVDLGQVAIEVVAEFQAQASRKHQHLIYHSPLEPALVVGDQVRLRQVIYNLVGNALKYTPTNGQVSALLQVSGGQILFKIQDNGPGIPPAEQPFVFDKFYRVENKARDDMPGTGLGLAICKSIIEKLGGTIWLESGYPQGSDYQQGSTFVFTLPLAPPDALQADDDPVLDSKALPTS